MVRLPILAGTCLALAAGAYGVSERQGKVADVAYQAEAQVPASYPLDRPAPLQSNDIRLAQPRGTVCQTSDGVVCTVAPQALNTPCACGGRQGRVVR